MGHGPILEAMADIRSLNLLWKTYSGTYAGRAPPAAGHRIAQRKRDDRP
ncbi:MAG: hypothetical protein LBD72_01660 [Puniceicoccales bacterium]|nr:hypothetical protein [Puniceicoccales bacterium]